MVYETFIFFMSKYTRLKYKIFYEIFFFEHLSLIFIKCSKESVYTKKLHYTIQFAILFCHFFLFSTE